MKLIPTSQLNRTRNIICGSVHNPKTNENKLPTQIIHGVIAPPTPCDPYSKSYNHQNLL